MNTENLNEIIKKTYANLTLNNFKTLGFESPLFEEPIVGIVAGDDSYYDFLKEHIGPFHWSPTEVLGLKYDISKLNSKNIRVISMVFPQTERTRVAQRKAITFPSDNWVVSRGEWEPLMREFSGALIDKLEKKGYKAVSIDLQPEFKRETSDNLGIASRWSHRHSAYAAGLATFSLTDALISIKGMAVRVTSTIIEIDPSIDSIDPTCTVKNRPGPYDWCLYYKNGTCGACIKRCPCDAISKNGHDKEVCSQYEKVCLPNWPAHIERGDYIFGCGLCQTKIPCEFKRP